MRGIIGTEGYIAWLYGIIYLKIRNACKNIFVKMFVHSIGLILGIIGIFYLIATIPSFLSVLGVIIALFGIIIFVTPLGIEK